MVDSEVNIRNYQQFPESSITHNDPRCQLRFQRYHNKETSHDTSNFSNVRIHHISNGYTNDISDLTTDNISELFSTRPSPGKDSFTSQITPPSETRIVANTAKPQSFVDVNSRDENCCSKQDFDDSIIRGLHDSVNKDTDSSYNEDSTDDNYNEDSNDNSVDEDSTDDSYNEDSNDDSVNEDSNDDNVNEDSTDDSYNEDSTDDSYNEVSTNDSYNEDSNDDSVYEKSGDRVDDRVKNDCGESDEYRVDVVSDFENDYEDPDDSNEDIDDDSDEDEANEGSDDLNGVGEYSDDLNGAGEYSDDSDEDETNEGSDDDNVSIDSDGNVYEDSDDSVYENSNDSDEYEIDERPDDNITYEDSDDSVHKEFDEIVHEDSEDNSHDDSDDRVHKDFDEIVHEDSDDSAHENSDDSYDGRFDAVSNESNEDRVVENSIDNNEDRVYEIRGFWTTIQMFVMGSNVGENRYDSDDLDHHATVGEDHHGFVGYLTRLLLDFYNSVSQYVTEIVYGPSEDLPSRKMSMEEISTLPLMKFSNLRNHATHFLEIRCQVCLSDYQQVDNLRTLPCFHSFHQECIDQWLIIKNQCPICRETVSV